HAGCKIEAVVKALGLKMEDLFPPDYSGKRGLIAVYDYSDERGGLLFQTVRYTPKDFRQRRPDGDGGWVPNLDGVRRVLYRLPEVMKAVAAGETVWVAEGEKDADTLTNFGLCATCSPLGAGKWRAEYAETLRGALVVVIPDNDKP